MKYHVPTGFGFSPKASGFYPFGDATDLAGEGGIGDVVWMIQACLKSGRPQHKRQVRSTGIAKRLFFMFLFPCRQYFLCGGICEMGIFLGR
ncbi:MAG: hypothetical protein SPG67_03000 [Sodaliphilus sp.]|nr:hypothetical protein [Sodaliphilus sp.]